MMLSEHYRPSPREPWRTQTHEAWVHVGQQVRDKFGCWWIVSLPHDDDAYGCAQVEVASNKGGKPERHIWLREFLRDFRPIE